jgi:hypothetical protein
MGPGRTWLARHPAKQPAFLRAQGSVGLSTVASLNKINLGVDRRNRPTFDFSQATKSLWIDALCIDQENVSERYHQVQQMGEISISSNWTVSRKRILGSSLDHTKIGSGEGHLDRRSRPSSSLSSSPTSRAEIWSAETKVPRVERLRTCHTFSNQANL